MNLRLRQLIKNEKGYTLLELIVSIALLSLIVGSMLTAFVSTTKINIGSSAIANEGYIVQDWMEKVYALSLSKDLSGMVDNIKNTEGFSYTESGSVGEKEHEFKKEIGSYYVRIAIKEKPYSVARVEVKRVIVEVFKDNSYTNPVAMAQNYINID